ncbi:MAG TPA: prepilin-type N-terminal cleavage/methylation domain-containing protein [Candidatus Saccharimonadales bacterium]|nr:prepilin-type N-terminal cleavage/methylation domain-containing protein [Candidatus Saccharimonadales bacterium]
MQIQKFKKNKSAGFTLIELLIVIIIIGILAAIAFVAYSGSQNKAKKAGAEATLSQIRSKLAEYNSEFGYYPTTQNDFNTWLSSSSGGNNTTLSTKFTSANGYTYNANDGGNPSGSCDNAGTPCSGYSATAAGSIFGGSSITVTN